MACISRVWVSDTPRCSGRYTRNDWADILCAEGDVEGVMDRPIGNTAEVHAECEKWYVCPNTAPEKIISDPN
jgi:hypothetical protein